MEFEKRDLFQDIKARMDFENANDTSEIERLVRIEGVSTECAQKIVQLRRRGQSTPDKECHLIELDKAGMQLPIVFDGSF